jgi:hypothetical protein
MDMAEPGIRPKVKRGILDRSHDQRLFDAAQYGPGTPLERA